MNDSLDLELDALNRDLTAAAADLGPTPDWERVRAGVRHATRRPYLRLAWTIGLAACAVLGFARTGLGSMLMVAIGSVLFVIPRRLRDVKTSKAALAAPSKEELLDLLDKEHTQELAHHFSHALSSLLLALLMGTLSLVLGLLLKRIPPQPSALVALIMVGFSGFHVWRFLRMRPYGPERSEAEDDEDDQ